MSLSITINNINDLTDTEREVLRLVVGDVRTTAVRLAGPSITKQYIESLVPKDGDPNNNSLDNLDVVRNATAAPIPASAELDSAGLPWDKRIHSSGRTKLQDGTWRKLKGLDDTLVATVEAELRAVQAIPVPQTHGSAELDADAEKLEAMAGEGAAGPTLADVGLPPVPAATLAEMQAKLAAAEELPQHPVPAPPANVATMMPSLLKEAVVVSAPLTFADLMKHVTPMLVSGKLPQDTLLAVTAEFGLPHLAALGARPDLVEAVRARIDEVCK
jgi:hypothetical protein